MTCYVMNDIDIPFRHHCRQTYFGVQHLFIQRPVIAPSPEVQRPECEADHLSPSEAGINKT
jgi:hypothetical protein